MKIKLVVAIALVAGLVAVCTPVFAHHGGAAYDLSHVVVLKNAKVTSVLFANPHIVVYVDATDQNGKVVHWVLEGSSPENVAHQGWKSGTLQAGDVIPTVRIFQVKAGTPNGRLADLTLSNGKVFESFGGVEHPVGGAETNCNQRTLSGGAGALDCFDKGKTNK